MAESNPSADMRLPKRLLAFHSIARSQKRICVTPDRGNIPSPDDDLANLQPRSREDITSGPNSNTEAFLGQCQDVDMSDDSFKTLPFADLSPSDIGNEVVEGVEANIQEICYGAVRY